MSIREIGAILNSMYVNALPGEQVVQIHLFGIKCGELIERNSLAVKEIVEDSGINISYKTEVSKGIKLSKYVTPLV